MKLSKIYVLSSSISGSSANGDVTGTGEISDPIAEAAKGAEIVCRLQVSRKPEGSPTFRVKILTNEAIQLLLFRPGVSD
jgi:hypothetical protein